VIMGANVGTTVTAWILSLSGIESSNIIVQMFKPTSFTPILALVGIVFYMFSDKTKRKDTGLILLGFATLMFGMDTMSESVSGLKNVPEFTKLFTFFENPILGVIAGAVLTAVIQSSSASVGILQALASTNGVTYGAALPIIMGQNIGTCVTAILSSFGANRNAKRVAFVHLLFNIIGTVILLTSLYVVKYTINPVLLHMNATGFGIAVAHSVFNISCTIILLPASGLLEKLVHIIVPDGKGNDKITELDERLLATPSVALEHCHSYALEMAKCSVSALKDSIKVLVQYDEETANSIREKEEKSDHYEDIIGDYLVKLSTRTLSSYDRAQSAKLLKIIGDFERISDHSVNILESAEELKEKDIKFTEIASQELDVLTSAVNEITDLSLEAFINDNLDAAVMVEPLEEIIDTLKEKLRSRHIYRLQHQHCDIDAGFVWSDLITNFERTSDHCSNIAACVIDMAHNNLNLHESLRNYKFENPEYKKNYEMLLEKYKLPKLDM